MVLAPVPLLALAQFVLLVPLLTLITGCYSFTGSNLPGHIKSLGVPTFENSTLEPGVEQEATSTITDQFISDGRLRIASPSASDARLIGKLSGYENKVNNYDGDQPRDYIVVVTLSVQMRDQVKNQDLWREDKMVATAVYDPGEGETEEEARATALQTLASDIVGRTLEQW